MRQRGTTMIITLIVLAVISLLGVSMSNTVQTEMAVTTARQWLSETRENAEKGLAVFMETTANAVLQPGIVDQTFDYGVTAGFDTVPAILNQDEIEVRVQELFCGDDGSTNTGNMLGTGAKRVWYHIESCAVTDDNQTNDGLSICQGDVRAGTRAQVNLGASHLAPPNACNY